MDLLQFVIVVFHEYIFTYYFRRKNLNLNEFVIHVVPMGFEARKPEFVTCNGAVTYKRIKVTDASGQKICKKCLSCDGRLSGDECRCGSRKERIRTQCTEQVTDKEKPTNVRVTDV